MMNFLMNMIIFIKILIEKKTTLITFLITIQILCYKSMKIINSKYNNKMYKNIWKNQSYCIDKNQKNFWVKNHQQKLLLKKDSHR